LGDRFAVRFAAFALVIVLVAGAGLASFIGYFKYSNSERTSGIWSVSVPDLLLNRPYVETDAFQARAVRDFSHLIEIYATFGDNDPRSPDYDVTTDPLAIEYYDYTIRAIHETMISSPEWRHYISASPPVYVSDEASDTASGEASGSVPDRQNNGSLTMSMRDCLDRGYFIRNGAYEDIYDMYPDETLRFDFAPMIADPILVHKRNWTEDNVTMTEITPADIGAFGVQETFEKLYEAQFSKIWDAVAQYRAREYERSIAELNKSELSYFIGNTTASIANVRLDKTGYPADSAAFTSAPAYLLIKNGNVSGTFADMKAFGDMINELAAEPESFIRSWSVKPESMPVFSQNFSLYCAYDREALAPAAEALTQLRETARRYFIPAALAFVFALVFFIFLIITTGRRRADGTRKLYALDKVFMEIQAGIVVLAVIFAVLGVFPLCSQIIDRNGLVDFSDDYTQLRIFALVGFVAICLIPSVWCIFSMIRNIKAGLFLKRSIIWQLFAFLYRAVKAVCDTVKSGFDGRNPFAKTFLLVGFMLVASFFSGLLLYAARYSGASLLILAFFAAICAFSIGFAYRKVKDFGALKKGIEQIANGHLQWRIPVKETEKSEFANLSRCVNEIGEATNIAVQSELKNQRLKTDLISNVSHDLKTPLTSIITYADLLKKEGFRSKNASEYLDVIEEKGKRLQKLTEDLFDAAKASSGAVQVFKEKLDLFSLLNQEIAEMADGLAAAELKIIINGVDFGTEGGMEVAACRYVFADSRLLWRVVDNLLSNVRKYALPGSRVYIDISDRKDGLTDAGTAGLFGAGSFGTENGIAGATHGFSRSMIVMEMKNISKSKLNIPADELMERFKRGDESRTTDGSGLGLAIANDLVRLQGGRFEIVIDGDLFKTVTVLEAWEDPSENS
jgi:signal transduction histidine kinase